MKKSNYLLLILILLAILSFLSGCGTDNTTKKTDIPPVITAYTDQIADATKPASVSGSVFSLSNGVLDSPTGTYIELIDTTNPTIKYITHASTRGSYLFTDIPQGKYNIFACIPDKTLPVLSGEIKGITVTGNIPSQMNNILIGRPQDMGIIEGKILQNGNAVPFASVTLDIAAYGIGHLEDVTNLDEIGCLLTTTTDNVGQYRFTIPIGANTIYLAAHSTTSMSGDSAISGFSAGSVVSKNINLVNAESPIYPIVEFDIFSTTLEKSTLDNIQAAAAITRVNSNKNRSVRLSNIADRLANRLKRGSSITSFVENDVFWFLQNSDVGTLGFDVFRSDSLLTDYVKIGRCDDPYYQYFFDMDPALITKPITYYRVRGYAANNKFGPISNSVVSASPLPQFVDMTPANNAALVRKSGDAKIKWPRINGAQSYIVAIYTSPPNANSIPPEYSIQFDDGKDIQEYDISGHQPGDYWWVVAAYNTMDLSEATSGSFSTYRKLTITE